MRLNTGRVRLRLQRDAVEGYRQRPYRAGDGRAWQRNHCGGQRYELKQFHFHHPSEEKIDGKSYALVAHLAHGNAEVKLVVVGVMFDEGAENRALKTLWADQPSEKEMVAIASGTSFNPTSLLLPTRSYYHFSDSLTTPPCSEGVSWFVLRTPVEASKAQTERFAARYPMNARPT